MKIHRHFRYQPSDAKVTVGLLCILLVATITTVVINRQEPVTNADEQQTEKRDSLKTWQKHKSKENIIYYRQQEQSAERFAFDPNTADSTQLLRLGLQPWQVRNIYIYRAKGGIYRVPSDFAKLYGLTQKQYKELEPYIRISNDYKPAADLVARQDPKRDSMSFHAKINEQERIVLNTADTNALKRIPGIGSYYARIIYNYGKRLGGYVSIDQIDEIEDVPSDAKHYMTISHPVTQKMNINRLTINQLKHHPYMGFYRAKTIIDYRRIHGPIHNLKELQVSPDFTDEAIKRLLPYIEY